MTRGFLRTTWTSRASRLILLPIASRMALERAGRYVFLSVPGRNGLSDLYFGTDFFSELDRPQRWRVRPAASLPASAPGRFGAFPQINIGSTDDSTGIVRLLPDGARRDVFVFFRLQRNEPVRIDEVGRYNAPDFVSCTQGPRASLQTYACSPSTDTVTSTTTSVCSAT